MIKPNIPGIGAMADSFDFVKNLWGSMGVPGTTMPGMNVPGIAIPTLSVEEINKRISDLKAVESWLTLNMNMLRSTIQALEVQAATITALQSMGESFAASMSSASSPADQSQGEPKGGAAAGSSSASKTTNGINGANGAHDVAGETGSAGQQARAARTAEPTSNDESAAANLTAPLVNAAAWWNLLQDQFKQAVGNAMAAESSPAPTDEKNHAQADPKPKATAKPKAGASHTASATDANGTANSTIGTTAGSPARKRKATK